MQTARGVILVGHGGIPKDCPSDLVTKLKRLEGLRRQSGQPISAEEAELDRKIRRVAAEREDRSLSNRP